MTDTNIKAMRRVSAYRTSDGNVHEDRDAAVRHQARIDLAVIVDRRGSIHNDDVEIIVNNLIEYAPDAQRLLRQTQKGL